MRVCAELALDAFEYKLPTTSSKHLVSCLNGGPRKSAWLLLWRRYANVVIRQISEDCVEEEEEEAGSRLARQ